MIKKFNKKEFNLILLVVVIFQILILMNMCFADSYVISKTNDINNEINVDISDGFEKIIEKGVNLISSFLSIKQIGTVSASLLGCCLETKEGATCQDVVIGEGQCNGNEMSTTCENVASCRLGCCVDEEEGLCSENSPKTSCENDGGDWDDDFACNLAECQNGCCVLGSETVFTTEKRCEKLSLVYGLEEDFRSGVNTEVACILVSESSVEGACVTGESCVFNTGQECVEMNGDFHAGYLCSSDNLETDCERQTYVGCVEGEDEIYWFDSCGNKENIYSSNKDSSWNNGKVLSKAESCGAKDSNANSATCGNCDYYLGSVCSETSFGEKSIEDGDFICRDLNCYNTYDESDRLNGESWCVYDYPVAEGRPAPGARYWKHMCVDGEEVVEPCADYRQEVCVQEDVEVPSGTMYQATCTINEWRRCYMYNDLEDQERMIAKCDDDPHCFPYNVWNATDNDEMWVCLPEYSPGFAFWGEGAEAASATCSMASQEVEITEVKDCGFLGLGSIFGGSHWDCYVNCIAEEENWTISMNRWCTSLGDCGAYQNYKGAMTTGGYSVSGVAKELSEEYLSTVLEWDLHDSGALTKMGGSVSSAIQSSGVDWTMIIGAGGGAFAAWTQIEGGIIGATDFLGITSIDAMTGSSFANGIWATPGVQAAGAGVAVLVAGLIIGKLFGLGGKYAFQAAMVGAIVASSLVLFNAASFGAATGWGVLVVVVLVIIMSLFGCGNTRHKDAGFECRVWEQPEGGEQCEVCNDPLHPCSEYRCKSLGAACELIDEDTSNPKCIWSDPHDVSPPVMLPSNELISEGYSFNSQDGCLPTCSNGVKRDSDTGCLEAYEKINIGFETDEYARCKFDFENKEYDLLSHTISGVYTTDHEFTIGSPGIERLEDYLYSLLELEGPATVDIQDAISNGNLRVFIKCKDPNGNTNSVPLILDMCVDPEPDLTPPYIRSITPASGSKIRYNSTESNVTLYTNEPSNCRYSSSNRNYSEMEGEFACNTDLKDEEFYGWKCTTTMTGLSSSENIQYIKCMDLEGNVNEAYEYVLSATENPLQIKYIYPEKDEKVEAGFTPVTVNLEVHTSDGAANGEATCYYKFNESDDYIQFYSTFSTYHSQIFNTLGKGDYSIFIMCEDEPGDITYDETSFSVSIDPNPPEVVRIYNEGKLVMITNEDAECYYSFERCNFNFENATSMSSAFSKVHYANWVAGQTYYIKCADVWGNTNSDCTIKIRATTE